MTAPVLFLHSSRSATAFYQEDSIFQNCYLRTHNSKETCSNGLNQSNKNIRTMIDQTRNTAINTNIWQGKRLAWATTKRSVNRRRRRRRRRSGISHSDLSARVLPHKYIQRIDISLWFERSTDQSCSFYTKDQSFFLFASATKVFFNHQSKIFILYF